MDFELIIIGAGVSGLCLSRLFIGSSIANKSLLLIDGAHDEELLRTLSLWDEQPSVFDDLVKHRFSSLALREGSQVVVESPLESPRYRTLFFTDLQHTVIAEVQATPGCQVVSARVTHVESQTDHAVVSVGSVQYRARWVFDSRFVLSNLTVASPRYHFLRQHFTGWLIRTAHAAFVPHQVTLFDFQTGGQRGASFFYVLPLSEHEAVVDLVTLDSVDAPPLIDRYLREVWQLSEYEVIATEHGVSPLTEQPFAAMAAPRVRRIGIAAGRLKPSTGYALTRIEQDCRTIVKALEQQQSVMPLPQAHPFFRFADGVLLEIWQHHPEQMPAIFVQMFRCNSAAQVFQFLDEKAGFWTVLSIIVRLPFLPFLVACLRWFRRRYKVWW